MSLQFNSDNYQNIFKKIKTWNSYQGLGPGAAVRYASTAFRETPTKPITVYHLNSQQIPTLFILQVAGLDIRSILHCFRGSFIYSLYGMSNVGNHRNRNYPMTVLSYLVHIAKVGIFLFFFFFLKDQVRSKPHTNEETNRQVWGIGMPMVVCKHVHHIGQYVVSKTSLAYSLHSLFCIQLQIEDLQSFKTC